MVFIDLSWKNIYLLYQLRGISVDYFRIIRIVLYSFENTRSMTTMCIFLREVSKPNLANTELPMAISFLEYTTPYPFEQIHHGMEILTW